MFLEPEQHAGADAVDQFVDNRGDDDVAAQPMCADCVRCGLDDGEREVLRETIGEDLIVRDRRCAQFRRQYVLRLRHQHSKFRPQETLPGTRPDRQRLGVGQRFFQSLHGARRDEVLDQPLVLIEQGRCAVLGQADREGLIFTGLEHRCGHLVLGRRE